MNKLIVVEDKKIDLGEYNLDIKNDVSITIEKDVTIHDINNYNKKLNIKINKDGKLKLYMIKNLNDDYDIKITLYNKAFFEFNMLILNKGKHQVNIDIDMIQNEAQGIINVRAINTEKNSNLDIICKGYIKEKTKENELVENLKGLIIGEDETIKISPIMIVDTNEVSANHLVTIGNFNQEELFYLQCMGISYEVAKKLLIDSFLKCNMKDLELDFLNLGGEDK